VPHKKTGKTPYELWEGRKPNLEYLKVWGCLAKVMLPEPKKRKLGSRICECVFIGYACNSSCYRFLVIKSDVLDSNIIFESKNAIFFELVFPMKEKEKTLYKPIDATNKLVNDVHEIRRSKLARKEKSFGNDFIAYIVEDEPVNYNDAIKSIDGSFWLEAINDELDSIMSNHTWELVELPPKIKPIGCKWIFKRKLKPDGTIDKYKARLVAKGYRQKQNVDYFDTYSPVTRIASIRILFAIASIYKLVVYQMDVKTAFLNGDLEEEIYMKQPEGCVVPGQERKVCKLVKSLYGLKQAPKQWHEKFDKVMLSNAYVINGANKCIYSKFNNSEVVIICLYVDDLLIFGTNLDIVHDTKRFLGSNFDLKDMGEANVILSIKILRNDDCIILSKSHYVEKVLKRF
jgi:hypothetical protein